MQIYVNLKSCNKRCNEKVVAFWSYGIPYHYALFAVTALFVNVYFWYKLGHLTSSKLQWTWLCSWYI